MVSTSGDVVAVAVTVTVADADLEGSCTLVAVTVTFVFAETCGAMKRPVPEIEPAVADQLTAVFVAWATLA